MPNNKNKTNSIFALTLLLSIFFLLSTIAFAIPNSLTLQGKLTNLAGSSQQGTFNFTFKIYDNVTGGNELWSVINQSVTTDVNGIYDVILTGLNLSFADQYYLGIAVQGENESTPRINLTSAPYSFRANISESLNPNASYFVRNISISGHATIGNGTSLIEVSTQAFNITTSGNVSLAGNITLGNQIVFRLGEIIDNLVDGWLKLTGALNVTSGLVVGGGINVSNGLNVISGNVGIGTTSPAESLTIVGNASVTNLTVTSNLSVISLPLGWTNLTNYPGACPAGQFITQVGDTLTCATPSPSSGGGWTDDDNIIRLTTLTDTVSIGSNATLAKLYVNDSSAAGAFLITNASGTTIFFVNGSTARIGIGNTTTPVDTLTIIGSLSTFGSLNATFINATIIRVGNNIVQVEADAFKQSNFTSAYGTEYSSTGFKRGNVTDFFGDSGFNGSVLRVGNISNVRESLWTFANNESAVLDNGSIIRTGNLTTLDTVNNYIRTKDFTIANISNNTIPLGANLSIALWNTTFGNTTQVYTRDANARVLIGTLNLTAVNLTEALVVVGNVNVSGYVNISGDLIVNKKFNVTASSGNVNVEGTISAGGVISSQGQALQQEVNAFKISNYSTEYASTGYKLANFTSNLNTQNASLWNRSSTNTILRFNDDNIGIGTTSPGQKLHVVGSANISATINAPVLNTTRADQNITISSGGGSVIIRLG